MKNLNEVQSLVDDLVKKYDLECGLDTRYIDFMSEAGELGKEILKGTDYGTRDFSIQDDFSMELGDTFFSLVCIANSAGVSLSDCLSGAVMKYDARFSEKGNIGSGNN